MLFFSEGWRIWWPCRGLFFVCVCVFGRGESQELKQVATTNNSRSIKVKLCSLDPAHPAKTIYQPDGKAILELAYGLNIWKAFQIEPTESHKKSESHPEVRWLLHPEIYMESRRNPVKIKRGWDTTWGTVKMYHMCLTVFERLSVFWGTISFYRVFAASHP